MKGTFSATSFSPDGIGGGPGGGGAGAVAASDGLDDGAGALPGAGIAAFSTAAISFVPGRQLELGEIEKAGDADGDDRDHADHHRPHPARRAGRRLARGLLELRRRERPVLAPHRDHIGVHGGRDVLHFLRADIGELHGQLVGHLLMHGARHADAADLGEPFETRGDVDAVAEQIAVALDHVADGDADAEGHLPARRIGHVAGPQAFLDVDGAAHGFDRARKFGEHRVARRVEDAAARLGDEVVGDGTIGGETPQRLLFVLGHQPGIAGNISRKNRRDLAFHDSQPPDLDLQAQECRLRRSDATEFRRPPQAAGADFIRFLSGLPADRIMPNASRWFPARAGCS